MLLLSIKRSLGELSNWPLFTEDKKRPKKEAGHSTMGGGSFIKQLNLHVRFLCLEQSQEQ